MNIKEQLSAWTALGEILAEELPLSLQESVEKSHTSNPWFSLENISNAIKQNAQNLTRENLEEWLSPYKDKLNSPRTRKNVSIVMAGNIPLVGFHDFLCVLLSNHSVLAKLSHQDCHLLPTIAKMLCDIEPRFSERIRFTTDKIAGFDAVIATGSNNTSRYFDYYFGKYPNLIRKNRNSIAVLTGNESEAELSALADDVFLYFGLGCRSVSKIFVPKDYDFENLRKAFNRYSHLIEHPKHSMNYTYYKAIYAMNDIQWHDLSNILLVENTSLSAPPAILNYSHYTKVEEINSFIEFQLDSLQCVASSDKRIKSSIPFGTAQSPKLNDYADDIDTLMFLLDL